MPTKTETPEADSQIPSAVQTATQKVPAQLTLLYGVTVFAGAFLLFLVEPLIAKLILPWFGGTAAVWATCLVFFQTALLLGYSYAHETGRRLAPQRQALLHIALLVVSLYWLPLAPEAAWRGHVTVDPALRILGLLTFSIGLPFVLLSATGPLVQTWYARRSPGTSPYTLFALSNAASLLALLSFPFVIERRLASHPQAILWSIGYGLFVACCAASAWASRRVARTAIPTTKNASQDPPLYTNETPRPRTKLLWLALAACGSMMLLSATNHLAENVAPIPLLWVVPLSLYLLSFALVFAKRRSYSRWLSTRLLAVALGGAGYAVYDSSLTHAIQVSVPLFCGALFIVCLFCHGELALRKPSARHLTSFYLMIALGGAIGGICIGLAAPHSLPGVFELPMVLLLTAALALVVLWREGWSAQVFWSAVTVAMAVVLVLNIRSARQDTVAMTRNFYGALRIQEFRTMMRIPYRSLIHGTIEHGAQFLTFPENRNPTTYYGRHSGVGLAIELCCKGPKRVGVIGLGTGTLAAYGNAGDSFRFYEINPKVVEIAKNWFTYLKQTPAKTEIVLGDARLSLESEEPQRFDVLAVDAFSGDAIPVHLLTREAFALYFRHLKPDGILAVHTSNTYLDLSPVVKLLAEDADYPSRLISSDGEPQRLVSDADWVLVTRNQEFLNVPETFAGSKTVEVPSSLRVWTDDNNNLFDVLRPLRYVLQSAGKP